MNNDLNPVTAKIMYHPLLWVHVDYKPHAQGKRRPEEIALLNTMIIDLYNLPLSLPDAGTRVEQLLLKNWNILPEVALALCSYRYRDKLMRKGNFTRLPTKVRQFASLSLGERRPAPNIDPDLKQLKLLAMHELLVWQHQISSSLIKRLPLLFPLSSEAMNIPLIPDIDITLFQQAIQYVHFTSDPSFRAAAD